MDFDERRCQRELFMPQDMNNGSSANTHYRPHSFMLGHVGFDSGGFMFPGSGSFGSASAMEEPRHIPNAWEELDMEGDTFQWTNCLHVVAEEAKECTVFMSQTHLSVLYTNSQQSREPGCCSSDRKRDGNYKYGTVIKQTPDPRALQNISPNLSHNAKHYNIGSTAKGSSDNPINFQINNDLKVIKVPTNDSIEVQNAPDFSGVNNFEVLKDQDRKDWEKDVEDNQINDGPVEISWSLQSLTEAYPRRYRMRDNAVEIFGPSNVGYFPAKYSISSSSSSRIAPDRVEKKPFGRTKPMPPLIAATRDPLTGVLISPLSEKSIYISFQPLPGREYAQDQQNTKKSINGNQQQVLNIEDAADRRQRDFLWRLKVYAPQLNLDYWHSLSISKSSSAGSFPTEIKNPLLSLMDAWRRGAISNYDYLMRLNAISGRSVHDITSYPVLPWVLSNYTSQVLDLEDPKNYRDLSKPMGALHQERLENVFLKRYFALESMNSVISASPQKQRTIPPDEDMDTSHDGDFAENDRNTVIPPFMYGSHYSTAGGVVLHYLVRLKPFAHLHRQLQDGKFDCADRLFDSIPRTWEMCSGKSQSEVKELTKEWYSDPSFLRNSHRFQLGKSVDGKQISDVTLPPWACGSPERFVQLMRVALESDVCSKMLHKWIDLIFGFKQRGSEAIKAHNVFYHMTYYDDDSPVLGEKRKNEVELHMAGFGRCPTQLFDKPHKPKVLIHNGKIKNFF